MTMPDQKESVREALKEAIASADNSQSELARRMSVVAKPPRAKPYQQQLISHWLKVGSVPPEHASNIERAVHVSRHRLCPGVFDEPAASAA